MRQFARGDLSDCLATMPICRCATSELGHLVCFVMQLTGREQAIVLLQHHATPIFVVAGTSAQLELLSQHPAVCHC